MSQQYASLREKIRAEKLAREADYVRFADLCTAAHEAGVRAAASAVPAPMVLVDVMTGQRTVVPGGPGGGYGTVEVRPANSRFANWAKKNGWKYDSYRRCVYRTVLPTEQSPVRIEAYAYAFAGVLRDGGIVAIGNVRCS